MVSCISMGKGVGDIAVFEKYDEGIWILMCAMLTAKYECGTVFIVQYPKARRILKDKYLDPGRTAISGSQRPGENWARNPWS